jgi:hypothetical protein
LPKEPDEIPAPLVRLALGLACAAGLARPAPAQEVTMSASLEGQPDWRSLRLDGTWPAPPHPVEGHTWHHSDALLFDYVDRGGAAALADLGVEFRSGMPAFGDVLTEDEIEAILGYIASTWPEDIRAAQEAVE